VEHQRAREPDHLLNLLTGVRHHGQRPERERRVRGLVHHDVVGDLVDERLALAQLAQRLTRCDGHAAPFSWKTSTGPSPRPSPAWALRKAAGATPAAPRAAPSRARPPPEPAPSRAPRRRPP